jgi:hypothetical protein
MDKVGAQPVKTKDGQNKCPSFQQKKAVRKKLRAQETPISARLSVGQKNCRPKSPLGPFFILVGGLSGGFYLLILFCTRPWGKEKKWGACV